MLALVAKAERQLVSVTGAPGASSPAQRTGWKCFIALLILGTDSQIIAAARKDTTVVLHELSVMFMSHASFNSPSSFWLCKLRSPY
jgi:hypothetical protein